MKKRKLCIIVFWLCLALPGILYPVLKDHIDSKNYEKRTYAEFPVVSWKTLTEFPSGFEAYYNDRVPFKNQFTRMNTRIEHLINRDKSLLEFMAGLERVTVGREGWLYLTNVTPDEDSVRDYLGTNLYTEEELKWLGEYYQNVSDYFKEKGIEFVLFVPPNKEQVYDEYMPKNVKMTKGENRAEQAVRYITEHTDVKAVYARDALLEGKKQYPMYYKYDSHWNSLGAFVGVQLLTELLQGEHVSLKDIEIEEKESVGGDLSDLLGITKDCTDDKGYVVKGYKEDVKVKTVEEERWIYYHFQSNAKDQRRVLVINDSFAEAMMEHLAKCFKEVTFINSIEPERAKEILNEDPPDILILEILERRRESFGELAGWLIE